MKENKKQILKALVSKHIETIEEAKLNTISGGNIVVCEPIAS